MLEEQKKASLNVDFKPTILPCEVKWSKCEFFTSIRTATLFLSESLSLPSPSVSNWSKVVESSWTALLMRSSSLTQEKKCGIAQNAKTRDIFIICVNLLPHSVGNARRLMLLPPVPHYLNISNVQTVCKITKFALALVLLRPKPWLIILPTFPPSNQLTACQSIITIIAKRLTHPRQALNAGKSTCNTPD